MRRGFQLDFSSDSHDTAASSSQSSFVAIHSCQGQTIHANLAPALASASATASHALSSVFFHPNDVLNELLVVSLSIKFSQPRCRRTIYDYYETSEMLHCVCVSALRSGLVVLSALLRKYRPCFAEANVRQNLSTRTQGAADLGYEIRKEPVN